MNFPKYPLEASDDKYTFEFYSDGPKGKILKTVVYSEITGNTFNLGFGDWNEELQHLDDSNRTNNGDRDIVLTTVAYSVVKCTDWFPNAQVFIEGSILARTRLYQMAIAHNLLEINDNYLVKGFYNEEWEVFQPGRNYDAFLITRK